MTRTVTSEIATMAVPWHGCALTAPSTVVDVAVVEARAKLVGADPDKLSTDDFFAATKARFQLAREDVPALVAELLEARAELAIERALNAKRRVAIDEAQRTLRGAL